MRIPFHLKNQLSFGLIEGSFEIRGYMFQR
jgi:hypothetical protein